MLISQWAPKTQQEKPYSNWRKLRSSVSPLTHEIDELCVCLDPGSWFLCLSLCPSAHLFNMLHWNAWIKWWKDYFKEYHEVLCTYFCCHDKFIILKYEQCWGDVSVIPSILMMFNEFTDNIFVVLTCFLTKISTNLKIVSLISVCYIKFNNANHYQTRFISIICNEKNMKNYKVS